MNALEYISKLHDQMSGVLRRVGTATTDTSRKVEKLKKETDSLGKVNLSGILSALTQAAGVLGIGALVGKTIKSGMEQEMRETSFEVLFGGANNAKKIIDEVSTYAAKSPYGKAELSEAVQTMAGYNIAQEKIMPNMKAIGDIAMGNKEKFGALTLAYSQMISSGKLRGQELMQMINAGFNPLNQMSKTTGKSVGELMDLMARGAISSEMVTRAFIDATSAGGQYYNMNEILFETASGQWDAAMENMAEKLGKVYKDVLQPLLLPALKILNRLLEEPIKTIKQLVGAFTSNFPVISGIIIAVTAAFVSYKLILLAINGVHALVAGWRAILVAYEITVFAVKNSTNLWAAAQWLLNVAIGLNPVVAMVAGIVALIAIITFLIIKLDGWGQMWQHTVNGCKLIWQAYTSYVAANFNLMINGLMIGINRIKEGWYQFKEAVGLGNSQENQRMLAQINADTEARKKSIKDGYKQSVLAAVNATTEFSRAASSLKWNKTSLGDVVGGIKEKLGISPVKQGIAQAVIPGGAGATAGGNTKRGGGGGGGAKQAAESIATGGSKSTNIVIHLGSLVNSMSVSGETKEAAGNIRDIVADELMRVLYMAEAQG